jgi:hypothetical protein
MNEKTTLPGGDETDINAFAASLKDYEIRITPGWMTTADLTAEGRPSQESEFLSASCIVGTRT